MKWLAKICVGRPRLGWLMVFALSIPPLLGLMGHRIAEPLPAGWVPVEVIDALRECEGQFKSNAPVVLVLECDEFFRQDRVRAMHKAVAAVRAMEDVEHVTWMGDIPEVTLRGQQTFLLPESSEELTSERLATAKSTLMAHPLVAENLMSADGRTVLVLVNTQERPVVQLVRETAIQHLQSVGIQTRVTGALALYDVHDRALAKDHFRIQFLAYGLVGLLQILIFRRPMAIIVACGGPVVGVTWTLGWLLLLGQGENELAKIILPVMIVMIGFTDGVHVVVRLRQLQASGATLQDSIYNALLQTGPACLLTSITTAIGFGSLMLSKSEMIAGFGRVSAIGVIVTFFAVILVSPLLAGSWVGQRMAVSSQQDPLSRLMNRFIGVVSFSSRHARLVTITGIVITVSCLVACSKLVPDDRVSNRVPRECEEWHAMQHCDEHVGGIRYLRLMVNWPEGTPRKDVWTVLRKCEELIAQQELLGRPMSIRTTLSVFKGPNRQDQSVLANKLPDDLKDQFYRPDLRLALVVTRMRDLGVATFDPIFEQLQGELHTLEAAHAGFEVQFVSDMIIEGRVVSQMIHELLDSLTMAAFVIFGVLAFAFRSLRLGLISIVPNTMPLAASGAMRLWMGDSLGIAGACSFAICLGIAVDDTIHYLTHFQHERRKGYSPLVANQKCFTTVGSALLMTTVVMMAGLGTVMTSHLPPHVNFATMACTTLAVALFADLVFLPALLTLFPGKCLVAKQEASSVDASVLTIARPMHSAGEIR